MHEFLIQSTLGKATKYSTVVPFCLNNIAAVVL